MQGEIRFDGFGRSTLERNGTNFVLKQYDGKSRLWKVSNPSNNGSYLYTVNSFDALDRVVEVKRPDNLSITTAYEPDGAKVTDEDLVARKSRYDALGRVVAVVENPNGAAMTTQYAYNALDHLLTVCPPGGTLTGTSCSGSDRVRSFSYDMLGRILTASNPESSLITYVYDEVASTNGKGNLTSKSQLRGFGTSASPTVTVGTRFHYDSWNRLVGKNYSGAPSGITTPDVSFSYDVHKPCGWSGELCQGASDASGCERRRGNGDRQL